MLCMQHEMHFVGTILSKGAIGRPDSTGLRPITSCKNFGKKINRIFQIKCTVYYGIEFIYCGHSGAAVAAAAVKENILV